VSFFFAPFCQGKPLVLVRYGYSVTGAKKDFLMNPLEKKTDSGRTSSGIRF